MRNPIFTSFALLLFVSCAESVKDGTVEKVDTVSYNIINERNESDGQAFVKSCVSKLYKGLADSPQGFFFDNDSGIGGLSERGDEMASKLGLPSEEDLVSALLGNGESSPSVKGALDVFNFKIVQYTYKTVDQRNDPVILSSVLAVPYEHWYSSDIGSPTSIVIDCHSTITSNDEAPTSADPNSFLLAANGSLVVCPDYLGLGCSEDFDQLYLCSGIGARQVLDAVRAAVKLLRKEYNVELDENYYTQVTGYGQGGAMALAVAREIENMRPEDEEQFDFRLRNTVCGGAPVDLRNTACWYLDMQYPINPSLVPLALKGLISGNEDLFRDLKYEVFFTDDYLSSGIDDLLSYPKSLDIDQIDCLIDEKIETYGLRGIVSGELYDEYEKYRNGEPEGRLLSPLLTALDRNTLFCDGWIPSNPILLYHVKNDDVVPFFNFEYAVNKLTDYGCNFKCSTRDINAGGFGFNHKSAEYVFSIMLASGLESDWFDE